MSGKEAIIEKILAQAEELCAKTLEDAEQKAASVLQRSAEQIESKKAAAEQKATEDAAEILRRRKSVADLEVRKYQLTVKQQLMDTAFRKAHQSVLEMDDKTYLQLISKLLIKYAENGETLTVGKKDAKRITQDFVDKTVKNKKITVSSLQGDFDGGFVLSGNGYDKNLTLKVLLESVRSELEPKIAAVLFEVK